MKVTTGTPWIISCTENFEKTVTFFRDVMGLAITDDGIPVTDTQFTRFVQFTMPNGVVLEIVEPNETVLRLYTGPILSISVDDIFQARREMEEKRVEFVSTTFKTTQKWGWAYFRAPDGQIYQIQGPIKDE